MNKAYIILVVEDEWLSAEFISDTLLTLGQNVIGVVPSAKEALLIASSVKVDLAFMDINLQGSVDGISLAKLLDEEKAIPIIYMTAFGDSKTIEEASTTNIYGFIIKPFTQSDIEAVLNVAMARIKIEYHSMHTIAVKKTQLNLGHEYIYSFEREALYLHNKIIQLSKNESKLLLLFCSNYGHTVSLSQIRSYVWQDKEVIDSTIRDTIFRLRRKIQKLNFENIVGIGYCLRKEVQA
ncbi:MAG: hypothetical protein COA92_00990 [Sulfurovum sp.]|nr:MAG: hypothetical protein COA92_00990 [Sulfurovum sp.]